MTTRTATFDRQALIACCRARLQSGQRTVRERYLCEGDAPRLLHERCQLIDGILCDLWQALELPSSLALVAVGGYGRGELYPASDVDILLQAVRMSRYIDAVYFPILCILLVGTYHMHFMLLAGDWDFWLDWKDRQWWRVVTPIVGIMYCAALMYYLWVNYRLPFGATLCIVCLLVGEWLTRYWGFYWWSHYPINFVLPSTMIPGALMLDTILLLTGNWLVTALLGGGFFGLFFYPGNWPIFGTTHLPVVVERRTVISS